MFILLSDIMHTSAVDWFRSRRPHAPAPLSVPRCSVYLAANSDSPHSSAHDSRSPETPSRTPSEAWPPQVFCSFR
jgi:hypothetical protein